MISGGSVQPELFCDAYNFTLCVFVSEMSKYRCNYSFKNKDVFSNDKTENRLKILIVLLKGL